MGNFATDQRNFTTVSNGTLGSNCTTENAREIKTKRTFCFYSPNVFELNIY